jgi:cobalt-precorrin-5B (C1)-methyltransferase
MGDFAGGLLKYLRVHPVLRLTIAGGFAKLTKLAQGALDLHSGRSQVRYEHGFQQRAGTLGAERTIAKQRIRSCQHCARGAGNDPAEAGLDLPSDWSLPEARNTALETLRGAPGRG